MSEENTATPVEASADVPATDEAAEAIFNASGDGKTAPAVESSKETTATPDKTEETTTAEPKVDPKPAAPALDPVKAAEARAAQIDQEKNAATVAAEAARIDAANKAKAEAEKPAAAHTATLNLADIEKNLLETDLKDFKIKGANGEEVTLADFMDDQKGYGEVARGAISAATAIASKLIEKALAPLQAKIDAYEGEKAQAAASAAHEEFISKVASETAHKDVAVVEKSDALWSWLKTQTPQMNALASSKDVRDIDLLLSAFKSATGYKAPAPGKSDRQAILDKQKADREKADRIARATTRSRSAAPSSESVDGEIETIEDAQKAFDEAAAAAAKK